MSTPSGRTGYPKFNAATDTPDGAAQDEAVSDHFDALIGETVATAASLPGSGNWVGREIMTVDTVDVYRCVALPATWKQVGAPIGAWIAYTPALTADSGSPNVGTGGIRTGHFQKVGKTVHFRVFLKLAPLLTGFNAGSGVWKVSLPLAAVAGADVSFAIPVAVVLSGVGYFVGAGRVSGGGTVVDLMSITQSAGALVGSGISWTQNSEITISGTYEVA